MDDGCVQTDMVANLKELGERGMALIYWPAGVVCSNPGWCVITTNWWDGYYNRVSGPCESLQEVLKQAAKSQESGEAT